MDRIYFIYINTCSALHFEMSPMRKLQALVYDILPLEEGAGKRCSECALSASQWRLQRSSLRPSSLNNVVIGQQKVPILFSFFFCIANTSNRKIIFSLCHFSQMRHSEQRYWQFVFGRWVCVHHELSSDQASVNREQRDARLFRGPLNQLILCAKRIHHRDTDTHSAKAAEVLSLSLSLCCFEQQQSGPKRQSNVGGKHRCLYRTRISLASPPHPPPPPPPPPVYTEFPPHPDVNIKPPPPAPHVYTKQGFPSPPPKKKPPPTPMSRQRTGESHPPTPIPPHLRAPKYAPQFRQAHGDLD